VDNRRHPIYVDGLLEGHDFPADPGVLYVQAIEPRELDINSYLPGKPTTYPDDLGTVTYRLRQFEFHSGGAGVSFWVGSCSPGEPDAMTLLRAIMKPELLDRVDPFPLPRVKR
jgi:hypothetical protein